MENSPNSTIAFATANFTGARLKYQISNCSRQQMTGPRQLHSNNANASQLNRQLNRSQEI
jgi:hypothetical protein